MPMLLRTENIACAAYLKIAHRNAEACAELGKFLYCA